MATSFPVTFSPRTLYIYMASFGSLPTPATATRSKGTMASFQDFLPTMAERLGANGLIEELCKGFRLLMDPAKGVITLESLRRNSAALGLDGLGDEELVGMVREGDLNGDGALDQMEFCVLMVRLSPELMEGSERAVWEALEADRSSGV